MRNLFVSNSALIERDESESGAKLRAAKKEDGGVILGNFEP
jgi:hypothetical protein